MYTIKRMPEFDEWIGSLRDRQTSLRLLRRLEKAQRGLLGDVAPEVRHLFAKIPISPPQRANEFNHLRRFLGQE